MFSLVVNGTDLAGRIQTESGVQTLTTLADHGNVGASGIEFDDPDGTLAADLTGWLPAYAEESDCSQPRLWTGHVLVRDISRGLDGNRVLAANQQNTTLLDLNNLLAWKLLLMGADNKRPEEGEDDRMSWLLTTRAMIPSATTFPGIFDNGLIDTSGGQQFDAGDFRGNFAGEVLASMSTTSKNFYVYRDHGSDQASLFWDQPDAPVRDSTLKISNDLADVDNDLVWRPYRDARLARDPSEVYAGVLLIYAGDQWVFHQDAGTALAYADREYKYESSRIGRTTTADDNAVRFLADHDHEFDTISATVLLPSSRVGLVEAGQRIQVKFTHLPGYEDFVWMRIVGLDLRFAVGGNTAWYAVTLDLSMKILASFPGGGGGGGGVDKTPFEPPPSDECQPDLDTDVLLAATVTATSNDDAAVLPLDPSNANDGDPSTYTTVNAIIVGAGTYESNWDMDLGSAQIMADVEVDRSPPGAGSSGSSPITETPGTGGTVTWHLFFSDDGSGYTETSYSYTTPGLYSILTPAETAAHRYWRWQRSYVVGGLTFLKQHSFYRFSIHVCVPSDQSAVPAAGQFTTWLKVGDGDGSTVAFTFPYPFASGSLEVRYDTVDQTNAILSYDGTTGSFTMAGAPITGQQVFARAQGI